MKYNRIEDGEWVLARRAGHNIACCDCGLVHTVKFRSHNGRIQFSAVRNKRSTGQVRRWMK